MSKLQLEKDENTDHLQEKVKTLENRLLAQNLSGDDRVEALQEEVRSNMYHESEHAQKPS